jgi:hypothetical protein
MIDRQILNELSKNLSADRYDFMTAFRKNVNMYLKESHFTIRALSEEADIPFETLKSFLHMGTKDCKVSTAVKLARALGISVDELIGAETLEFDFKHNCAICRNIPENAMYLINWMVRHQERIYKSASEGSRVVSVMRPDVDKSGNLNPTYDFNTLDISSVSNDIKYKVFLGIQLPDDRYMPTYTPYDILLIANDREPSFNENCLVMCCGNLYIGKRIEDKDNMKYFSVRGGKFRLYEHEIDELIGYVAYTARDLEGIMQRI